ncbi:hypothetical protein DHEL01_v209950 [Diaporthe helianthi]|uniref:Uncharacterized protein n=1 Tax=Diaporthe helianthi TaxID=158607 RepID=A0A2P5HN07_DIAHE|nr:hypothetical protein DHEL01_v209950 [Diaporthe helianthi]
MPTDKQDIVVPALWLKSDERAAAATRFAQVRLGSEQARLIIIHNDSILDAQRHVMGSRGLGLHSLSRSLRRPHGVETWARDDVVDSVHNAHEPRDERLGQPLWPRPSPSPLAGGGLCENLGERKRSTSSKV